MDLEQTAIERLKMASHMSEKLYKAPLIVTTSGGKDSGVVVELARRSGIAFEVQHNHTTADAPETVRFVRSELARLEGLGIPCSVMYPKQKGERTSMWKLVAEWGLPDRHKRFCCSVLKEQGGAGRFIATGVRWAESKKRATRGIYETSPAKIKDRITLNNDNDERRQLFESCQLKAKRVCNPIIDWTDADVWEYSKAEKIPMNPLYTCGFDRVGCVGCPLANRKKRYRDFAYWPKYKQLYLAAIERNIEKMKRDGTKMLAETAEDYFHWWLEDDYVPGQMEMDDFAEGA